MAQALEHRWEQPQWIARHVGECLPAGVVVTARIFPWDHRVEVSLRTSWWRWWTYVRRRRKRILVQAVCAAADAPVGTRVRVGWR